MPLGKTGREQHAADLKMGQSQPAKTCRAVHEGR